MIGRFLGAIQFLTILPIRKRTASPGESAVFFPLVGAFLGASAGAVLLVSRNFGPLFAIIWLLIVTGCLHEDGLADVADAVRAGRTREKMLSILKDSRIGTYGALALIASFTLRWQSLAQGIAYPVASLAAVLALSRTSLVIVSAVTPPAGTGMGNDFAAALSRSVVIATIVQAVVIVVLASWFIDWRQGAVLIATAIAVSFLAKTYFTRSLGGVTGDCLGATCQVVEIVCLIILAWRPSS